MRGWGEFVAIAFAMILVGAIAYTLFTNINQITTKNPTAQVIGTLKKTLEVVDYGITQNNKVYVYLRPTSIVNISKIHVIVNGKPAKVYEVGDGDGIIDPNKGELIEVVFNETKGKTDYSLLVSGSNIVSGSFDIDISGKWKYIPPNTEFCSIINWLYPRNMCRIPINVTYSKVVNNFQLNLTVDTQSLISLGKLRADCGDLRFSAVFPYEGSNYNDGLVLDYHFDYGSGDIAYDYSGLNNNGSINNATWDYGFFGLSLNFTGSYFSYVKTNYSSSLYLPNAFSIVAWIKPTSALLGRNATSWWNDSWKYRKPITIYNNATTPLTNFQVNLTIDTASLIAQGKLRSDCGDLRFTYYDPNTGEETEIPYWIESGCNTTSTKIWIKVPYIPASGSSTVYMYYGNPSATSNENPEEVFEFFDHFDSPSLNLTKWKVLNNLSSFTKNSWLYFGDNYSKVLVTNKTFNLPIRVLFRYKFPIDYSLYTHIGGIYRDNLTTIITYGGNIFVGGYEISDTYGLRDGYVASISSNDLSRLWDLHIGGLDWDMFYDMINDSLGNIYLVGEENSTLTRIGSRYSYFDGFLVKVSPTGSVLAQYHYGYPYTLSTFYSVDYGSSSGNLYIGGIYWYLEYYNYIASINPSTGGINWQYYLGPGGGLFDVKSDVLPTGEVVYGVGSSHDNTTTAPDGVIVAFDSLGNYLWGDLIGGLKEDMLTGVTVDSSHYVYVVGIENSTTTGNHNIFLVKLYPNGTPIWQKIIGDLDAYWCFIKYYQGYLYLGCSMNTSTRGVESLIAKLDTNGNIIWARYIGGVKNDYLNEFALNGNYLYVVGRENNTDYGGSDGCIIKINITNPGDFTVYYNNSAIQLYPANIYDSPGTLTISFITYNPNSAPLRSNTLLFSYSATTLRQDINQSIYSLAIAFNDSLFTTDYIQIGTTIPYNVTISIGTNKIDFQKRLNVLTTYSGEIIFTPTQITLYTNNTTFTQTGNLNSLSGQLDISSVSESALDYIAVAKYIDPLPKYVVGGEQMEAGLVFKKGSQIYLAAGNGNIIARVGNGVIVAPYNLSAWQSVIIVYNGSYESLYINGSLIDSTPASTTTSNTSIIIGRYFIGNIDEVRLYNRALTSKEIYLISKGELEKQIPYFIEQETCNTNYTHVYVRVPMLTNGTVHLYMYYCSPYETSVSNGYKVFEFFDHFDNYKIDSWWTPENLAQWVESGTVISSQPGNTLSVKPLMYNVRGFDNVIIKAKGRWTSTNDDLGIVVYADTSGDAYALWHGYGTPPTSSYCIARYTAYGSPTFLSCYSFDLAQNQWGYFEVEIKNGEILGRIWPAGLADPPWEVSYTVTPYGNRIGIFYWNDRSSVEFDWIFVRKLITPWCNVTYGPEEKCTS